MKKQKPIATMRSAWGPGGRVATKALRAAPVITASTAAVAPPAARIAASHVPEFMTVSASRRMLPEAGAASRKASK